MKKPKRVALIAAGNLAGSPVSRFARLHEQLGPVKSLSYRLASRVANTLRAGHPVKDYAEFEDCHVILISVPDAALPETIRDLTSAGISWPGKTVLLASASLASGELEPLAALGAASGSLCGIPGFEDQWYLLEGDKLAIRESRSFVDPGARRALAIERGRKPLFLASLTCTGSPLFALLQAASECLRHAGLSSAEAAAILEKQLLRTLRTSAKAGRRAYPVPHGLPNQIEALSKQDPELARYLQQSCDLAARFMHRT